MLTCGTSTVGEMMAEVNKNTDYKTTSGGSGSNSWVKFPDGTLIKYGYETFNTQSSSTNIFGSTAGQTFKPDNDAYVVFDATVPFLSTPSVATTYDVTYGESHAAGISTTQFYPRIQARDQGGDKKLSWIAIGRWK